VAHDFNNLLNGDLASRGAVRRSQTDEMTFKRLLDGAIRAAETARPPPPGGCGLRTAPGLRPESVDVAPPRLRHGRDAAAIARPAIEIAADSRRAATDPRRSQPLELAILNLSLNCATPCPGGRLRMGPYEKIMPMRS